MTRIYFIASTAILMWALTLPYIWIEQALTTQTGACYVHFEQKFPDNPAKAEHRANAMYARARRELLAYYLDWMPADRAWKKVMQRRGPELGADFICEIWMGDNE